MGGYIIRASRTRAYRGPAPERSWPRAILGHSENRLDSSIQVLRRLHWILSWPPRVRLKSNSVERRVKFKTRHRETKGGVGDQRRGVTRMVELFAILIEGTSVLFSRLMMRGSRWLVLLFKAERSEPGLALAIGSEADD